MEYGYEGLDPGLKVWYLLNGIRCDKLSTATATVRHVKIGMRRILMLLLPSSVNTLTREPQQLVWRLPLLGRADRPSNRRPALPVSCSKKRLSWRSIPENNMTQCQWHCASSYMTSKKKTRAAGEDREFMQHLFQGTAENITSALWGNAQAQSPGHDTGTDKSIVARTGKSSATQSATLSSIAARTITGSNATCKAANFSSSSTICPYTQPCIPEYPSQLWDQCGIKNLGTWHQTSTYFLQGWLKWYCYFYWGAQTMSQCNEVANQHAYHSCGLTWPSSSHQLPTAHSVWPHLFQRHQSPCPHLCYGKYKGSST